MRAKMSTNHASVWLFSVLSFFLLLTETAFANDAQITVLGKPEESARYRYVETLAVKRRYMQMTYIFGNDMSGYFNAAILRQLAQDNKDIYLLIDDFAAGHRISNAMIAHLVESGVKIKLYNPPTLKIWRYLKRLHDKLVVIDGESVILGGRNIGDSYYGIGELAWRDLDMGIKSKKLAADAEDYFWQIWNSQIAKNPSNLLVTTAKKLEAKALLDDILVQAKAHPVVNGELNDYLPAPAIVSENALSFLHFDFDSNNGRVAEPKILPTLLASAQKNLTLITPYFAPPVVFENLLAALVKKGVKVRIVTNSALSNNQKLVAAYYMASLKRYAELGFEIWETNDTTLHTKAVIIDDMTGVGTFNADAISWLKNLEIGIFIKDRTLTEKMASLFNRDYFATATLVAKDGQVVTPIFNCHGIKRIFLELIRDHI